MFCTAKPIIAKGPHERGADRLRVLLVGSGCSPWAGGRVRGATAGGEGPTACPPAPSSSAPATAVEPEIIHGRAPWVPGLTGAAWSQPGRGAEVRAGCWGLPCASLRIATLEVPKAPGQAVGLMCDPTAPSAPGLLLQVGEESRSCAQRVLSQGAGSPSGRVGWRQASLQGAGEGRSPRVGGQVSETAFQTWLFPFFFFFLSC